LLGNYLGQQFEEIESGEIQGGGIPAEKGVGNVREVAEKIGGRKPEF